MGSVTASTPPPSSWSRRSSVTPRLVDGLRAAWPGAPLLHFLALGAALFALERAFEAGATPPAREVIVPASKLTATLRDHAARTGRAPTRAERRALLAWTIDQEILLREALALGLDEGDPVVGRRLIQNLRFLDGSDRGDLRRLREARALGMLEGDLVVRRRLVQRMEQRLRAGSPQGPPSEAELAAHRLEQAARFTSPARVRLSHVFVGEGEGDAGALAHARGLRARLLAEGLGPERAGELGDAFLAGPHLSERSEAELAKLFGPALAARAMHLEPGVWSPPLSSPHGLHLLWLHERVEPELPPLDAIRGRVLHSLEEARGARALAEGLARLRDRYAVRVETPVDPEGGS